MAVGDDEFARSTEGVAPVPAQAFARRVAEYGGLDEGVAWRAAEAVVEALGARISAGQAKDLAAYLSEELATALKRGTARSKGAPKPLSLIEFDRLVADLEGVAPHQAREHARAVFLALRDAVPAKEFGDTVAQLPADYAALWDEAGGARSERPRDELAAPAPEGPDAAAGSASSPSPEILEVHAPKDLPRETMAAAREQLASLQRYVGRPLISARLTLRHPETRVARARWVADASVDLDGRVLAAHATGRDALEATDAVVDRLRRQIRRTVGQDVALRNEPRVIARALGELAHEVVHRPETGVKPAAERRVVRRLQAPDLPMSVTDAAAALLDADQEFRLFRHDATGDWLVVHRRDDERIGLIHPPWVPLPDVATEVLVVEPSPDADPITLDQAQQKLTAAGERFLYFVDAADKRPKVLYLRHDGDYGLVEPAAAGDPVAA